MQFSQEVLLLRDAMANAALSRGFFKEPEDDSAFPSAKLIKDTVKDVTDMMVVDDRTSEAICEAQRNMHSVLFHKALQSFGKLEDTFKEHVCASIPFVSWSIYVQAVSLCSWHDLADKCLGDVPESTFLDAAAMITKNMKTLDDDNAVSLWRCILRRLIATSINSVNRNYCRIAEITLEALHCSSTSMASKRAEVILEQLNFLCVLLYKNLTRVDLIESESSKQILSEFVGEADLALGSLDLSSPTCPFPVCHFSMSKLYEKTKETSLGAIVTSAIIGWPKRVHELKAANNVIENESVDLMKSIAATDDLEFVQDGLDKLVENLVTKMDDKVITFLGLRFLQVKQQHVTTLMAIRHDSADVEPRNAILDICVRAFSSWNLDLQDAYRNEFHKKYGLTVNEHGQEQLTDIVNRISSDEDVKTSTIADLSRLCLTLPMETIKVLVEHAVKHGQIQSIAKILFHLKGTCASRVSLEDASLLTYTLRAFILNDDLQMSLWRNCKALVEQLLLKSAGLDAIELVKDLAATFILPSLCCWRSLQVLRVILHSLDDDNLQEIWKTLDFTVILFLVSQILDECDSDSTSIATWVVLLVKEEAHVTLHALADLLKKHPHLMTITDRTWFLKSIAKFHKTVRFRLQLIVGDLDTPNDFEDKSVEDLLQIAVISKEVFNLVVNHLSLNRREILPENNTDTVIVLAFVKIFSRLTVVELRASMDVLIKFYQNDTCVAVVRAIRDVTEALIALSQLNRLHAAHELSLVQNLTTTVKALVDFHSPMPNNSLMNIVCTMARLSTCLVEPESQSVPKLLIVDLIKRIFSEESEISSVNVDSIYQRYIVISVVQVLNDDSLLDTVKRLTDKQ